MTRKLSRLWKSRRQPGPRAADEAFRHWAPSYDEDDNPLIAVEEPVMAELLGDLTGAVVLDAGCGTGRLMRLATCRGAARVVGVDRCIDMLGMADGVRVRGDCTRLPFADAAFDCVIAGLVIGYVERLKEFTLEAARVLRPNGRLVCSDLHPDGHRLGWRRTYRQADGTISEIAYFWHPFAEIRKALHSAAFELINFHEPPVPNGAPAEKACPAALIWSARLRP